MLPIPSSDVCASALPVQTWAVKQGRLDLYRLGASFEAILTQGGRATHVAQEWISGLPDRSVGCKQDKAYFSNTFAVVSPLTPSGHQVRVQHRLQGGMLRKGDAASFFDQLRRSGEDRLPVRAPIVPIHGFDREFQVIPFNPPALGQKMEDRGDNKFKILSIDGGGTRGIIPLKILRALERIIGPAHETFDLMAGTSTGGIITLGLTTPFAQHSADDLLKIYQTRPHEIFVTNPHRRIHNFTADFAAAFISHTTVLRNKIVGAMVDDPIYSGEGIKDIGGELMGETLMRDAKTNILIPAIEITDRPSACFFTNREENYAFLAMRDVAAATSAAPMYFPNKLIGHRRYLDGGLACNHPALQCHLYAARNRIPVDEQYVLSLGTGFTDVEGIGGSEERHNLLYWAKEVFPAVGATLTNTIDSNLYDALGDRYWRITPRMNEEIPLDSCSGAALDQLNDIADRLVEENQDRIREIALILRPDLF